MQFLGIVLCIIVMAFFLTNYLSSFFTAIDQMETLIHKYEKIVTLPNYYESKVDKDYVIFQIAELLRTKHIFEPEYSRAKEILLLYKDNEEIANTLYHLK
jgi:hypothetical protein